ncbi:MAG: hypothetical protein V4694_05930 [Pseudomonadota bacterium]
MAQDNLKKYKPILSITLPDENTLPKNEEDDDERFIKKDSKEEQKQTEEAQEKIEEVEAKPEVQSIIGKLKNFIFPKSNKRRDLDLEVGGLEAKEEKKSDEKDVWDERSEEVDKMGSTDTFNTTGMKSVVWKQKRARLAAKKHAKEGVEAAAASIAANQGGESNFNNMGYVAKLQNMRQDRSGITGGKNGGNDKGGAWR